MADFEGFDISELPPEALEQLISMGVLDEEQAMLAKQLEAAQAIRGRQGPRGRHTGRTYVAANPLEHLADFLGKRKAGKEIGTTEERMEAILGEKTAGREAFAKLAYPPQAPSSAQMGPPAPRAPSAQMGPPAPPTQNPGMGMPPPQPPQPNVPGPSLNVPQDQFNIEAGGDTTRGGGRVSVGGPPPPGGLPPPGISSLGGNPFEGSMPELWNPEAPMSAAQKYADALRKMGQKKSMGYF